MVARIRPKRTDHSCDDTRSLIRQPIAATLPARCSSWSKIGSRYHDNVCVCVKEMIAHRTHTALNLNMLLFIFGIRFSINKNVVYTIYALLFENCLSFFLFISSVLSNFVAPACARLFRLSLNIERLRNRTETLLNVIEFYETCITLWTICCWCCRCYVPFIMFFCYCHLLLLSHIWTALFVCVFVS